jgi:MFS family permease
MLIASRFAQGTAEALAAPAALSMVALLFTDEKERAKALGIWGGLAGLGAASGVLLSGVLTDLASWHWVFYIGILPCVVSLIMTYRLVPESREPQAQRPSWLSAVLLTGGLIAVIKGLLAAADTSWGSMAVLGPLVGGLLLLGGFVAFQSRSATPLVPLGFFTNRVRLTGYAAQMFMATATAAMFFLIVLHMQETLHYSPLQSGLAWLPFTVAFMPGLVVSTKLLPVAGSRIVLASGLLLIAVGVFLFSLLDPESSFVTGLLPAMALAAFGSGVTAPVMQMAALDGVSETNAGLGSGVLTTVQQVSQALGLSVIVAIGLGHQRSLIAEGVSPASAVTQGHALALQIAAAILLVGSIGCFALMKKSEPAAPAV